MLYTSWDLATEHRACDEALDNWKKHKKNKVKKSELIPLTDILNVLSLDNCLWALRATTDEAQAKIISVKFAIACADRVLIHYETKYPKDKRPRQAIETAQAYLLNPSKENAYAAYAAYAAADAADAADAARAAARAARAAADAAYAAYAAAYAAADAAYAAADAAYAAARAAADAAYAAAERDWQKKKLAELLGES